MPKLNFFVENLYLSFKTFEYTPLDIAYHQVINKPSKGGAMLEQTQAMTTYHYVTYTK
jgi:hypothetical protein